MRDAIVLCFLLRELLIVIDKKLIGMISGQRSKKHRQPAPFGADCRLRVIQFEY